MKQTRKYTPREGQWPPDSEPGVGVSGDELLDNTAPATSRILAISPIYTSPPRDETRVAATILLSLEGINYEMDFSGEITSGRSFSKGLTINPK